MGRFTIDSAFIEKWEPQYDEIECDEVAYKEILAAVSKNISDNRTLSKSTFERILDWKSRRVKGIVKWEEFDIYAEKFTECLQAPKDQKLPLLDELYGIGVPVASTILHFIDPRHFPIMDVRTVEALYYSGYIESKQRDQKRYVSFRTTMMSIVQQNPCWSLRQVDRALFTYHKRELEPAIRRNSPKATKS